jgi:hypothetical protein
MDIFKQLQDIVRADCERMGLPSPDGVKASEEAHEVMAKADAEFDRLYLRTPTNPATLKAKGIDL